MKRDISKKKLIPHPIQQVWDCLTNQESLSWLGECEIDLREGGKIKFADQGKSYTGEILTVQKPINLAYSWNDPSQSFTSYVWWKLMEQKDSTLVELEHSGFKGLKGIVSSYGYQNYWSRKLRNLEQVLREKESVNS